MGSSPSRNTAADITDSVKDTQTSAGAVSGRVADNVPGHVKGAQISAGAVSGRVVDKNTDQSSGPGRKLDSSNYTDTVPSVLDLTVSDIKHHNVGCQRVNSVVFMPNGYVVLACVYDGLRVLDKHFKELDHLLQVSTNVCKMSDTEVLVTSCKIILIVDVVEMAGKRALFVGKTSVGVHYHDNEIYVACVDGPGCGEVVVIKKDLNVTRRLGVYGETYMFAWPSDVKVNSAGDKVFVTDVMAQTLTCLDQSGRVIYQYKDADFTIPLGILVDRQDNVIVAGYSSHNVYVINKKGKRHKILLTKKDGLHCPRCISYRHDGLLAIGMEIQDKTKSLITFKI